MPEPWQDSSNRDSSQDGQSNAEEAIRRHAEKKLMFTKEELRVMQECNKESFYYRCLPLGLMFMGATQFLTNKGILKPHPRFGSLFKNAGAALTAFALGKLSYQGKCKEKLMSLPNSPLADALRGIKRDGTTVSEDDHKSRDHDSFPSTSTDNSQFDQKSEPLDKYDALRQQNRQEYQKSRQDRSKPAASSEAPKQGSDEPPKAVKRNKYGDVID